MIAPLTGKRIINTRAAHQAASFDSLLRKRGAVPMPYPAIAIVPPVKTAPLDFALQAITAHTYDWLVLTSQNVVFALSRRFELLDIDLAALSDIQVAAVGPSTAIAAAELLGVEIDLIPEEYIAQALASELPVKQGTRVLLPQSEIADPLLAELLTGAGATVAQVTAYRTVTGSGGINAPALIAKGRVDAITFTSPSTARNFLERFTAEGGSRAYLDRLCIAAIGPVTRDAVKELDLHVNVTPGEHTLEGMLDGLESYYLSLQKGFVKGK